MRRRPLILPLLALFGVLFSLTAFGAGSACASAASGTLGVDQPQVATREHACCRDAGTSAPQNQDGEPQKNRCAGNCLMQCCRAMMPADVTLDQIGQAEAVAAVPSLADTAASLTTPEPIFHPPKV